MVLSFHDPLVRGIAAAEVGVSRKGTGQILATGGGLTLFTVSYSSVRSRGPTAQCRLAPVAFALSGDFASHGNYVVIRQSSPVFRPGGACVLHHASIVLR